MPQGKHRGVRVALSVPPGLYKQLDMWAESEGRPVASLCMSIIEIGLRQAIRDGIAPSIQQVSESDNINELGKEMSEEIRNKFKEVIEEGNLTTKQAWEILKEKLDNQLDEEDIEYLRDIVGGFKDLTGARLIELRHKLGDSKPLIKALEELKGIELAYLDNIRDRTVDMIDDPLKLDKEERQKYALKLLESLKDK